MMRQAELEAKTKVSDSEVLYAAKEKARQIVAQAAERPASSTKWPMNTLRTPWDSTEEAVQAALDEVKQSRVRFRTVSSAKMQEQRDRLDGKMDVENGGDSE